MMRESERINRGEMGCTNKPEWGGGGGGGDSLLYQSLSVAAILCHDMGQEAGSYLGWSIVPHYLTPPDHVGLQILRFWLIKVLKYLAGQFLSEWT